MKYIYYKYKIRDCVRKKLITFYNVADDIVLDFFLYVLSSSCYRSRRI